MLRLGLLSRSSSIVASSPARLAQTPYARKYRDDERVIVSDDMPVEDSRPKARFTGINKMTVLGTVGGAPKLTKFNSGAMILNFSVATNSYSKDMKNNEWKVDTEWHDVVLVGKTVEKTSQILVKGARVYAEGPLRTRVVKDQHGNEQRRKQIVVGGANSAFQVVKLPTTPQDQDFGDDSGMF